MQRFVDFGTDSGKRLLLRLNNYIYYFNKLS